MKIEEDLLQKFARVMYKYGEQSEVVFKHATIMSLFLDELVLSFEKEDNEYLIQTLSFEAMGVRFSLHSNRTITLVVEDDEEEEDVVYEVKELMHKHLLQFLQWRLNAIQSLHTVSPKKPDNARLPSSE